MDSAARRIVFNCEKRFFYNKRWFRIRLPYTILDQKPQQRKVGSFALIAAQRGRHSWSWMRCGWPAEPSAWPSPSTWDMLGQCQRMVPASRPLIPGSNLGAERGVRQIALWILYKIKLFKNTALEGCKKKMPLQYVMWLIEKVKRGKKQVILYCSRINYLYLCFGSVLDFQILGQIQIREKTIRIPNMYRYCFKFHNAFLKNSQ